MPKRTWTSDQKRQVAARGSWRCATCLDLLNAAFEIDHVTALENGGLDDIQSNAQALCSNCHALKTQRERVDRILKARKRLQEIHPVENSVEPQIKRPEDVILDLTNPFAQYAFLPFQVKIVNKVSS